MLIEVLLEGFLRTFGKTGRTAAERTLGSVLAQCMCVNYMRPHFTEALAMTSLDNKSVAAHIIVALAEAHAKGRVARLDDIATDIGVRRADVRAVVTRLHAEGHVDALRLRLTMSGLALAAALDGCKLPEPRSSSHPVAARICA